MKPIQSVFVAEGNAPEAGMKEVTLRGALSWEAGSVPFMIAIDEVSNIWFILPYTKEMHQIRRELYMRLRSILIECEVFIP